MQDVNFLANLRDSYRRFFLYGLSVTEDDEPHGFEPRGNAERSLSISGRSTEEQNGEADPQWDITVGI